MHNFLEMMEFTRQHWRKFMQYWKLLGKFLNILFLTFSRLYFNWTEWKAIPSSPTNCWKLGWLLHGTLFSQLETWSPTSEDRRHKSTVWLKILYASSFSYGNWLSISIIIERSEAIHQMERLRRELYLLMLFLEIIATLFFMRKKKDFFTIETYSKVL